LRLVFETAQQLPQPFQRVTSLCWYFNKRKPRTCAGFPEKVIPLSSLAFCDSGIEEPADLVDRRVGIPGPFGASYMGFNAFLAENDLTEGDLTLESIGFTAPESVCEGVVEAAVVYVANEPLTIEENCFPVTVIRISDYANLVSNGLVTNEETIENNPDLVAGVVRAIQRGVEFTLAEPDEAFDISIEGYVLDLPEEEYETQRQVLENSLALWESDEPGITNPDQWAYTQEVMLEIEFISAPLDDLEASYNNDFIPVDDD
jgi:NitT/TauT family transport system substrate-binding protein